MTMRVADYAIQKVSEAGVRHVFLLTGGMAMHLNDALGLRKEITFICNLHEQACGIAAEAYAKYDNRLGALMVTGGPGATNAITGVAGGWLDSSPMIVLSGQVKRADLKGDSGVRNRGVQEIDIVPMVRSITKYAVTITDPSTVRFHLEKAIHLALSGRPGPVWIDIPLDVQASQVEPEELSGFTPEKTTPVSPQIGELVERAIEMLNNSERPFILLGNGVRIAGAQTELDEAIELCGFPFGLTWPAMDLIPDDQPLLVGRPGPMAPRGANFALQNSDLLLTIGARLDLVATAFAPEKLARAARKIMVDIDPKELEKLKGIIELPICFDAREFLRELLRQQSKLQKKPRTEWLRRCAEWKVKYPLVLPQHKEGSGRVSMFNFTEILCEELAATDVIVPASSGNAIETLLLAFKIKRGQRIFITTALGPMGFGLPASIGACIASSRRTICVDGDGGIQMNIQELETVKRLQLPLKIFVINNNGYGSIVASQKVYFGRLVGAEASSGLTLPDVTKVAAAYGLPVARITNQKNLRQEIRDVLSTEGPCLCEVLMIEDEPRQPRVSSMQRPDGTIVSKPLEDMFPFLDREEFLANMIIPAVAD
jgi:acetolactate synthase I/II/III large subunit